MRLPWIHAAHRTSAREFLAGAVLLCVAALCFGLYYPALNTPFLLDDAPNLAGLGTVHNLKSGIAFVLDGHAGPLGRPLSLASFLLNAPSWPSDPFAFKYTNVLIHILNGLLVAMFVICLAPALQRHKGRDIRLPLAVSVAALWLLQPLLASATLMSVQRMTTLSATFALLGMIGYIKGRTLLASRPTAGYMWLSASVPVCAALSMLAKENGFLLFPYLLVLEGTLLAASPIDHPWFRVWKRVFLWLPVLLLIGYLSYRWPSLHATYTTRAFTLGERLLTEPRVLAQYLGFILLPHRAGLGPFHEDFALSTGLMHPATTALALGFWIGLIGCALWARRHYPVFTFAVLWFIVGHLLESTVIPLEIYFEHRNYLPALGPVFAIAYAAWTTPPKLRSIAYGGFAAYLTLTALVLYAATQTWSSPALAASLWVREHPQSARAYQYLSQQYTMRDDMDSAARIIEQGHRHIPHDSGLALQVLQLDCYRNALTAQRKAGIMSELVGSDLSLGALPTLTKLLSIYDEHRCQTLKLDDLHQIADELLANPRFAASSYAMYSLYRFKSDLYAHEHNLDPAIRNLQKALQVQPDIDTVLTLTRYLLSAGLYDDALQEIKRARELIPTHSVRHLYWHSSLKKLEDAILRAKRLQGKEHPEPSPEPPQLGR